jgi:glycosyltransferase involved in cell wall biosynthesis
MRTALVHYWLIGMRGGEKVLESLCELYPDADIFTHVLNPAAISPTLQRHRIHTSFIARLPRAQTWYQKYLPLMPIALEQLDLRKYDLVISSESGPAKGILPTPEALHVCYCHSPMRYIWNMYQDYHGWAGPISRRMMPIITHYLRMWDQSATARVDNFIANSRTVAGRIRRYYHRDAQVIYPPIDVDSFAPVPEQGIEDYYLMVGCLTPYKRPDIAIQAFNATGKKLVVIGDGPMFSALRRSASENIRFLGAQPFAALRHYYARCRALVFPGEEDFGICPLEAMASGRPVVAFGQGGALETVVEGVTGTFFHQQHPDDLIVALERADKSHFDCAKIVTHARRFGIHRFKREMTNAIARAIEEKRDGTLAVHQPSLATTSRSVVGPLGRGVLAAAESSIHED